MIDAAGVVSRVEENLLALGDAERAAGAKRDLRSDLEFLGVGGQGARAAEPELVDRHLEAGDPRLLVRI